MTSEGTGSAYVLRTSGPEKAARVMLEYGKASARPEAAHEVPGGILIQDEVTAGRRSCPSDSTAGKWFDLLPFHCDGFYVWVNHEKKTR
jgi:hypothetical protein